MSSEKDFIEFLIFSNRYEFLSILISGFPDKFNGFSIVKDHYGSYELMSKDNNLTDINDLIDYELDLSLNDIGYGYYGRYLSGEFFNEEDSGDIIRDGLEFRLVKYYE